MNGVTMLTLWADGVGHRDPCDWCCSSVSVTALLTMEVLTSPVQHGEAECDERSVYSIALKILALKSHTPNEQVVISCLYRQQPLDIPAAYWLT